MGKFIDLTGERFGRLTVIERAGDYVDPAGNHRIMWKCRCDCGKETVVHGCTLRGGTANSCGCLQRESYRLAAEANRKINDYEDMGDYVVGVTAKGDRFMVDKVDFDKIKDFRWNTELGYVICNVHQKEQQNKRIRLHRMIMDAPEGMMVDHINHNKFDNRRCNLRLATRMENVHNSDNRNRNTSGCVGVVWHRRIRKWHAQIGYSGKCIHLGYYDDFNEAVAARKAAEDKYFGDFSYSNSMALAEANGYVE